MFQLWWSACHLMCHAVQRFVRTQRVPLVIVSGAIIVGQVFTLYGRLTFEDQFFDSGNYLAVAYHMAATFQIFNHLRTPVYPGFLATFITIHFPHPIASAIAVQIILMVATCYELYLLAYRLLRSQWSATIIATAFAANPYMVQWERAINSEGITNWLLVTLFLLIERYLRQARPRLLVWIVVLLALIVLTRPFYIFLPGLCLVLLGLHALRTGAWRQRWRSLTLALGVLVGIMTAYAVGNGIASGYYGISDSSNVNLFGLVMTCHLQDATPDPRFAHLKTDVDAYLTTYPSSGSFADPWPFLYIVHPEYQAHGGALVAAYSKSIIQHQPQQFARCAMAKIPPSWLPPGQLYGGPLQAPFQEPLLALGQVVLLSAYLALPFAIGVAIWGLWRNPHQTRAYMLVLLVLSIVSSIILTGALSYDPREYYRLRSPFDWGMVLLAVTTIDQVAHALAGQMVILVKPIFSKEKTPYAESYHQ